MTLVELLVASAISLVVMIAMYGLVRFFLSPSSKTSLGVVIGRTMTQRSLRIGLKNLVRRVSEGTEILRPSPGVTATELVFRDVLNHKVCIRLDERTGTLVSGRFEASSFARETKAVDMGRPKGSPVLIAHPLRIEQCRALRFTCLSPSCVIVCLSLGDDETPMALMTAIHLRNYAMAPHGEAP